MTRRISGALPVGLKGGRLAVEGNLQPRETGGMKASRMHRVERLLAVTTFLAVMGGLALIYLATRTPREPDPRTAGATSEEGRPTGHSAVAALATATGVHDWTAAIARLQRKHTKFRKQGPKRYDDPQGAMDFYLEQRLPEGVNVLPLEHLRRTRKALEARQAALKNDGSRLARYAVNANWTEIGPGNIGGRTRAIVIDPTNPSILYAAGVAGGVWKSTDAGASWSITDDFMLNLAVVTLAIDPTNANVLYAGTGEGFFNGDAMRGLGIFKSTDAGASWSQLTGTVTGVPDQAFFFVNDLLISPNDSNRLYAATQFGVWRSLDAGVSWDVVLSNPLFIADSSASNGSSTGCTELAIRSDTNPDVLLAAFGSFDTDGLFRSTDGGDTWSQLGTAADLRNSSQGRMALAIAPSNNDVMYVCMADAGGRLVNVYRSIDGGDSWSPRVNLGSVTGPFLLSNLVFATGCFGNSNLGQGWYDNVIAVDPVNPDIVWVGGIDLFRSDDGGQNFGIASYWYFSPGDAEFVHADQHAVVFHPNYNGTTNQVMYVGNDGGLYRTSNARAATSVEDCPFNGGFDPLPQIVWTSLNNGYGVTQFYHGDSAKDRDMFGGGTQDNGTLLVRSATTPNDWFEVIGGDGGYFAIDPSNSQIMYGETQRFPRIRKSTDGGANFSPAVTGITDADGLFITPIALDEANPNVLWTGGSRAWRTMNAAANWQRVSENFPEGGILSAIAIAPSDSNVVYLGFSNGVVARSTDALAASPTWTEFTTGNGLSSGFLSSLAVSPDDPNVAYCTYSTFNVPHILRTADGGQSWVSLDTLSASGVPDIPVHWIVVRPCNVEQLYVGTELGVFASDDTGATWVPVNNGLTFTRVETLDLQSDHLLTAFTHGRGAFRTALACPCDPAGAQFDCNNNGEPDECDIAFDVSPDCNENGIPDECDLSSQTSDDCNANDVPDECEADCNDNDIADECDIAALTSPDCNTNGIPDECEADCNGNGSPDDCDVASETSPDCNGNTFPDECDVASGGELAFVDFEAGLPAGWSVSGLFQVTGQCPVAPPCDGVSWAYAGVVTGCKYGDSQSGDLVSPPITLGVSASELRYCMVLDSELDFDFATVLINGLEVSRESGTTFGWEQRSLDLTPYAGQTVTITFRFASDASVSGTLGWQVDRIEVISGSEDCNSNQVPDECDLASASSPDANFNAVPDECEGACCIDGGGCVEVLQGAAHCAGLGGDLVVGTACVPDPCPSPALPPATAAAPHDRRKNRVLSFAPNNDQVVAFQLSLTNRECSSTAKKCATDVECTVCSGGVNDALACSIASDCPGGACVLSGETCNDAGAPVVLGWVGEPRDPSCVNLDTGALLPGSPPCAGIDFVSRVSSVPVFGTWTAAVLHIADCAIQPARTYSLRASTDGAVLTEPFHLRTIAKPQGKFWGDISGGFDGVAWLPPNGVVNVDDVTPWVRFVVLPSGNPARPHTSWVDLGGEDPNWIINATDLQLVLQGFGGKTYPPSSFSNQGGPATCP